MNVSVLTGGLDDRALIEDWRDLLDDAVFATPFQTPAWTDAWWRHFGARKQPHYLVFREGRDLVGILPLYITRGPWRSVRVVGTGQSDYLQPLVRSGHLQSVCAAIVGHLDEMGQSGVADIADLHQQRALVSLAAGDDHPVEQAICLVLDLPESYDDYLGALSKSLRFDCRRLEKRPFTDGGASVREVGLEQAQGALDAAFSSSGSHDWDLAAADLLVHEAGGALTDFTGRPLKYNGSQAVHGALVAAGQARHDALLGLLRDRNAEFA